MEVDDEGFEGDEGESEEKGEDHVDFVEVGTGFQLVEEVDDVGCDEQGLLGKEERVQTHHPHCSQEQVAVEDHSLGLVGILVVQIWLRKTRL